VPDTQTVFAERIARHGFGDDTAADVLAAVARTTAIQAQDFTAARLGVRARSRGLSDHAVRDAVEVGRTVVRSSFMRATIHLVPAGDAPWLAALLGPSIARRFAKRWRDLGLTPAVLDATAAAIPDILRGGPKTRAEVVAGLSDRGLWIDSSDPAAASTHVLLHATTVGLVFRGPDRGRDATFVLVGEWLPDAPPGPRGDDALAELARRYFAAYSPATAADFATWSGLPSGRAVALIRDELEPADVDGRPGYRLGQVPPWRGLRLLPAWDNYLVGYRERELLIDPAWKAVVYVGGVIKPTVLRDGRVVGIWRLVRRRDDLGVAVELFESLPRRAMSDLDEEVTDVGRFLDRSATLSLSA
jgi:hypothetical protein